MYGHLETKQLGMTSNIMKITIHNWKPTPHTRFISIAINILNKTPSPNGVVHY